MTAPDLLLRLLAAPGPSGAEGPPAEVWREEAVSAGFAEVAVDRLGNVVARSGEAGPLVALVGHVDEIGLSVTHVDERGLLAVRTVGGWDAEVAVGQRVTILARRGPLPGVVARASSRSAEKDEPGRATWRDVFVDIGARDADEARALVRPGDAAVVAAGPLELANGRLASRALDNRIGAYVVLEAARRIARSGLPCRIAAVAAVQEEIGSYGAQAAAFALRPDVAIAVDVTYATDYPGEDPRLDGDHPLGSGATIMRGPFVTASVAEALLDAADAEGIAHSIEVSGRVTATDADVLLASGAGVPTGVVSVPLRYMHSPVELTDLRDVEACVELLVSFAARLDPAAPFLSAR